jgi:sulfide:quinone oxidoreductase
MRKRTLILGAGFGGLTVATELRRLLGDEHGVVLIDRREEFLAGLRKIWALVGLGTLEEGCRRRETLRERGIPFLRREVRGIVPASRRVATDEETLDADFLVIALGAEPRPDLVPGLAEHAHDLYDARAIPRLAERLAGFDGGRIALVIAGAPYKCPPAPYECAMLLDEHLRERGIRDRTEIVVSTLQPILLPNAGKAGSAWLGAQLESRGIGFHTARKVEKVEAGRVVFAGGEVLEADVLIGVPPHRPPAVVKESGLAGPGDWIAVDPATLRTAHERVFAIGDVTQIPLANGLPLPKAGLFAEIQGALVAAAIASECGVGEPPPAFDGRGYCFVETGKSRATRVEGSFFARPEPEVRVLEPSEQHAREKRSFETERLKRWFGR